MAELKFPSEMVTLPSKGLLYPKENPLSSGQIEMKYMTAKEEDILTNANFIQNQTVIDKLLQSMVISKVNFDDILIGDKNAILIAARILGYGKDYAITYNGTEQVIDLTTLKEKELNDSLYTPGINEFSFTTPKTNTSLTFKLLTHGDDKKIETEIKGLKKVNPNGSYDITTRLKYMIISVNGERDPKTVREYVDTMLLAPDARALREYYNQIQPDIEMKFIPNDESYTGEGVVFTPGLSFFWPDSGL
jgi:hypothetical protein